jgi:hypothetical protein
LWLALLQPQALEKGATFGNKTLPMVWYMPTAASLAAAKSSEQQQVPVRSLACMRAGLALDKRIARDMWKCSMAALRHLMVRVLLMQLSCA